jgi:signal transduction histidine kinase
MTDKHDVAFQLEADNSKAGASKDLQPKADASEGNIRTLTADYEAKLDEVADLIARVRHEINNPLAGVLGQAQLLLREELSEKARKRAETIEQLAMRVRDIVAELRQVQKSPRS